VNNNAEFDSVKVTTMESLLLSKNGTAEFLYAKWTTMQSLIRRL
jgi:hypothetical protein